METYTKINQAIAFVRNSEKIIAIIAKRVFEVKKLNSSDFAVFNPCPGFSWQLRVVPEPVSTELINSQ